jgi:Tfp pilus assembly protein PilP
MTMVSRTGFAFVVVMLACATAWARPSPASAGQAGPAAIGAARGARTAVEQASEGKGPQAPATAPQAQAQKPAPAAEAQKPAQPATEAQTAAPPAAGAQTPAPAGQAPAAEALPPLDPPGFTYNPEGRRDPFVSLLRRGGATAAGGGATGSRPPGLAGLGVNEVTLRGTVQSRDGFVAILQGSDQKTYIVRPGDKLFDGSVRTITQNDMVFLQEVNDPLSLEKQREVRKVLRQTEGQN